jgi:hypothetical protein
MQELALEFGRLAIVGVSSGLFVSLLANRDFRRQRWWERRADAYSRVIEALSDMLDYYSNLYDAELEHRKLPPEREAELETHWRQGLRHVRRAANAGAFLFSAEAEAALEEFMSADKTFHDSHFEHLEHYHVAIEKCLRSFVSTSKRDLQIPSWRI